MGNRTEQIDRLDVRLKELDSEIRDLEALAEKALKEVKAEYRQQINELFLKKALVQDKVGKVQRSGGNVWEDMKAGTELSWEAFEESVKSRIKEKK